MRIIRFIDENDRTCFGHNYKDDTATLLEGRMFDEFRDTEQRVRVTKLLAPLMPAAILCIGLNYRQHANETGMKLPEYPPLFMKNPASVTNPGDPIIIPPSCVDPPQVDYEAELAVVIGKKAKDVPRAEALDYVMGYTASNDVSARRWQKHAGAGQWIRGKSFDTFCPLGPELITTDEIPSPQDLDLKCILNGKVMQDANTSDMIFGVAELIEYLSSSTTLLPGTVILTGTPGGVGYIQKPPVYLKPGDLIAVQIEHIGLLKNPVIL